MLTGRINGANEVYSPPNGWDVKKDGPCPKLYVKKCWFGRHEARSSAFYPTVQEIDSLKHGAPVHLTLLSYIQPPVLITVGESSADIMHPLPHALRVMSMKGAGIENAVVIEFDREPTSDQIELLSDFLSRE